MPTALTPQTFVAKSHPIELHERAMAQEHFIDLCRLLDHPTPAKPGDRRVTEEAHAHQPLKTRGPRGWTTRTQTRRRGLRRLRLARRPFDNLRQVRKKLRARFVRRRDPSRGCWR